MGRLVVSPEGSWVKALRSATSVLAIGAVFALPLAGCGGGASQPNQGTPASSTLSVTLAGTGSGTVTSSDGDVNCGTTCSASYSNGSSVTLKATAAAGSSFAGWSGGGCSGTTTTCTVSVTSATTVTATFNLPVANETLSVVLAGTGTGTVASSDGEINCGTTCSASYSNGSSVTLKATAAAGSSFAGWSGGGCSGTATTCTVSVTSATTVTVTFNLPAANQTLSVVLAGTGTGTVTSSDGQINCGPTCSATYPSGTAVALTEVPATGSTFAGWSIAGCSGTPSQCSVTVTSTTTVTATFNTPAATANEWIWMGGANTVGQSGVYGTQGTAATSSIPGGRNGAASWVDGTGNLWLLGGLGYDSKGNLGALNDLWEFNSTDKTWVWVSGDDTDNSLGDYGTIGVTSASNLPPAVYGVYAWPDSSGNFWMFSVNGVFALWEFNPATKLWTWVAGNSTGTYGGGSYGSKGVAVSSNLPPERDWPAIWVDSTGNIWMFGGSDQLSSTSSSGPDCPCIFNDLWEFNTTTQLWTWVNGNEGPYAEATNSGSNLNAGVTYGTQGVAAAANVPGARQASAAWTDSDGNLWLFGGGDFYGGGLTGNGDDNPLYVDTALNDLWEFNPTTGMWTWIGGTIYGNALGVYGVLGDPSTSNIPSNRAFATTSAQPDSSGNIWFFGGYASGVPDGQNNDLWSYNLSSNEWTWQNGADTPTPLTYDGSVPSSAIGSYGTLGVAALTNVPSQRSDAASWTDNNGNFWLFGGDGADAYTTSSISSYELNDLWFNGTLQSITITPANPALSTSATQTFTATGTFSGGLTFPLVVAWSSSNPNVATINSSTGVATAVGTGTTVITAQSGAVTASTSLFVN